MCHCIKFTVQLTKGDGFWIKDVSMRRFKVDSRWRHDALEIRLRMLQNLIALEVHKEKEKTL